MTFFKYRKTHNCYAVQRCISQWWLAVLTELISSVSGEAESGGKLTTWSNLGKQKSGDEKPRQSRCKEENSLNNNAAASSSRSLPEMGPRRSKSESRVDDGDPNFNDGKLVTAFIRSKEGADDRKLAHRLSWDGGASAELPNNTTGENLIPMMRSKDTVNHFLKNASKLTSIEEAAGESSSSSNDAPTLRKQQRQSHRQKSAPPRMYPDLSFLENDVTLWDAFFLHGKQQQHRPQSVLQSPLPVAAYLRDHNRRKIKSAVNSPSSPSVRRPATTSGIVRDSDSLRKLLPTAHKHLLGPESSPSAAASPITQMCESMSRVQCAERPSIHDIQNQAIKNLFKNPVTVVKVKEAWTEQPTEVVMRRSRKEKNLNVINNNGEHSTEELASKRRSYHPQDYLSKVLDPSELRKKPEFPKVR